MDWKVSREILWRRPPRVQIPPPAPPLFRAFYSHSMVAGGLWVMSYTPLVTEGNSLVILVEILSKILYGIFAKLAVAQHSFYPFDDRKSVRLVTEITRTHAFINPCIFQVPSL